MAMISNNSSFGSPSRPNPNARNSENNDPMRRSFSGNPFPKPSIIAKPRIFNPNTPANSPSDFPRRHSVGSKESIGSLRDLDDKENGKDQNLKAAKVRSPASASKGTKNFLSPTISASSKITVPPRKKVLVERNEPARTSISSTDGKSSILKMKIAEPIEGSNLKAGTGLEKRKSEALSESDLRPEVRKVTFAVPLEDAQDSDLKPGVGLEEKIFEASSSRFPDEGTKEEKHIALLIYEDLKVEEVFDVQVPLNPKNEAEITFETATQEADCVNLDPSFNPKNETEIPFETATQKPDCFNFDHSFKLSPTLPPFSSTSTILAPLDADPLMPPYDPKTNYLSPRPQFLHYRPKPRLYEDRDCVTLEESFISRSFSDTDIAEETHSEASDKESEDVSSDEIVKDEVQISESSSTERPMPKHTIGAEKMPKSRFFMRFKAIALLFLLSVACISISVTNSPVIDPIMFEELSIFSKLHESSDFFEFAKANFDGFSEFAKANFDGFSEFAKANFDSFSEFARNVHIWFSNLVYSISELMSNFRGGHNLAHLVYCNLSALYEDVSLDQYPTFSQIEKGVRDLPQLYSPLLNDEENGADTEVEIEEDIGTYEEHFVQLPQLYSSLLNDEENGADTEVEIEEDIGTYEEHFVQDTEVTATVETISDASEAEKVLESEDATAMEPSESRQALQQAGVRESNHLKSNEDITHQTASETSELHIEAFEASNQALEIDADINAEKVMNVDKDQPELNSEVAESHLELHDDGNVDLQLAEAEGDSISIDTAFGENLRRLEAVDLPQDMLTYVLLFLLLIAAATINYSRKDNCRTAKIASSVEKPQLSQTLHMSAPKEQISLDKPSLRNGATEEMDVLGGESCPSEMSSFQKSSSYVRKEIRELDESQSTQKKTTKNNRTESLASSDYSMDSPTSYYVRKETRELNEAQSIEKKPAKKNRRESLASSDYSMRSSPTSYGSFTTYDKVPNKHRHGDENTVTPVRRSSRIRNQATSPL